MPDRREKSESKYSFSSVKAAVICLLLIMALMLPACAGIAPAQEQAAADTQSAEAPASEPAPEEILPEEEAAIPEDNSEPDGAALSEGDEPAEPDQTGAEAVPQEETAPVAKKARQVDFSVRVNNIFTTAPTDDNYYSVQKFERNARMRLFLDEPISSLYIVWNDFPGSFYITVDGVRTEYDGSTYLHQFITLPQPSSDVMLTMPNRKTQLSDIYAFTEGTPPDWVQVWETLDEGETVDMLLFPTHSDDEFLFFGGVIPLYAGEQGKTLQVVYMNLYMEDFVIRTHELLNGLWCAGCHIYPVINDQVDVFTESYEEAKEYYGYDRFVSFQVEMIRRFKPKVIVEHDFNGEYGHPTHILNAYCMADAVNMAPFEEYYPESAAKYGVWDTPKTYFHLYKENAIVMNFETPLEHFDGATAADIASKAYGYYYSQHPYYWGVFFNGDYDCHKWGLYRSTVGIDENADMFDHIPE